MNDDNVKLHRIYIDIERCIEQNYFEIRSCYDSESLDSSFDFQAFLRKKREEEDKKEISERLSGKSETFSERLLKEIMKS